MFQAALRNAMLNNQASLQPIAPLLTDRSTGSSETKSTTTGGGGANKQDLTDVESGGRADRVVVGGNGIDKACFLWGDDFGATSMRSVYTPAIVLPFSSVTKLSAGVWCPVTAGSEYLLSYSTYCVWCPVTAGGEYLLSYSTYSHIHVSSRSLHDCRRRVRTYAQVVCICIAQDCGCLLLRLSTAHPPTHPLFVAVVLGSHIVLVKGAPEYVLARCTQQYGDVGQAVASPRSGGSSTIPLTSAAREAISAAVDAVSRKGQRVVALAELVLPQAAFPPDFQVSTTACTYSICTRTR